MTYNVFSGTLNPTQSINQAVTGWILAMQSEKCNFPGSPFCQVMQKHKLFEELLLIAYFICNVSAKKYQNPLTCVKVVASQRRDVFWDMV